jgi:hypothetical protein
LRLRLFLAAVELCDNLVVSLARGAGKVNPVL